MLPFKMDIIDLEGDVLVTLQRGWIFWMSKISFSDNTGNLLRTIQQKFAILKPTFKIFDETATAIATISGDWKGWNFTIVESTGDTVGTIPKKWNGFLKQAFITADKYVVDIEPAYAEDEKKIAIVSCAVTIDMVLKESK